MGDMGWVGKKPLRRLGGMADALSMASELGYAIPQEDAAQGDPLVSVLRELMVVQRSLADLQVELQGRQDDESVSHLTHVDAIQKKAETLSRTTAILKDVIQNKDRIIARLQQPYSLDCIPVETEYQRQFAELLLKAAGDYGALTAAISDLQWSQNFKDPPAVWGDLLRPIPVALASCTRYYEALSAMRETISSFYKRRVQLLNLSDASEKSDSDCMTPALQAWKQDAFLLDEPNSDDLLLRGRTRLKQMNQEQEWSGAPDALEADEDMKQRRMSWPPSPTSLTTPA